MRNLYLLLFLLQLNNHTNAQLFDGTILGAMPGKQNDLIKYFEEKGYQTVRCSDCSSEILFMLKAHDKHKDDSNINEYLIYMLRDEDTSIIKSISLYLPRTTDSLLTEFNYYRQSFINSFGLPSQTFESMSKWIFLNHTYTIGYEGEKVYHKVERNKSQRSNKVSNLFSHIQ